MSAIDLALEVKSVVAERDLLRSELEFANERKTAYRQALELIEVYSRTHVPGNTEAIRRLALETLRGGGR